jgi:hypothetical protein
MNKNLLAAELVKIAKDLMAKEKTAVGGQIPPLDNEVINHGLKYVLDYLSAFADWDLFNHYEEGMEDAGEQVRTHNAELAKNAREIGRELKQLARKCKV